MKLIEMAAHISDVPRGDAFDIPSDSIIIEDGGTEFLIGGEAQKYRPDSVRQFGGTIESKHYRRLLKGLVANLMGEGEHRVAPAISAAHHIVPAYRKESGSTELSVAAQSEMVDALSTIKFKKHRSNSQWQTCKVGFNEAPKVYFEYQAVIASMPETINNALVWQIGFGDWQQVLILGRKPMQGSAQRLEGLSSAIKIFCNDLDIAFGDGQTAWELEYICRDIKGGVTPCVSEKISALRHWISASLGDIRPTLEKWKTRFNACVISGGLCKDELFWSILQDEAKGIGFELCRINELPEQFADELTKNPSMTAVRGLLETNATLALDPGNGRLKAGYAP